VKSATLLRFAGAAVIATILVLGVTAYIVHKTQRPGHDMVMNVVKHIDRMSIGEVHALTGKKPEPRMPQKPPAPPPLAPRQVSGIVQVAFTVEPDGSAKDIHVTGAAPAGYYEKQAKAIVAGSYHKPAMGQDHRLHARAGSAIIHFKVPADKKSPEVSSSTSD
jgi:hypothetical protein